MERRGYQHYQPSLRNTPISNSHPTHLAIITGVVTPRSDVWDRGTSPPARCSDPCVEPTASPARQPGVTTGSPVGQGQVLCKL